MARLDRAQFLSPASDRSAAPIPSGFGSDELFALGQQGWEQYQAGDRAALVPPSGLTEQERMNWTKGFAAGRRESTLIPQEFGPTPEELGPGETRDGITFTQPEERRDEPTAIDRWEEMFERFERGQDLRHQEQIDELREIRDTEYRHAREAEARKFKMALQTTNLYNKYARGEARKRANMRGQLRRGVYTALRAAAMDYSAARAQMAQTLQQQAASGFSPLVRTQPPGG